jgi:hypothetical protein
LLLIMEDTIQKKYNKNYLQHQKKQIGQHQPARNGAENILPLQQPDGIQYVHQRTEQEYRQEITDNNDRGNHLAIANIIPPLKGCGHQKKCVAYQGHPRKKKLKVIAHTICLATKTQSCATVIILRVSFLICVFAAKIDNHK